MSLSETWNEFVRTNAAWAIHSGDCIEEMARMPGSIFDFAVFSPPFPVSLCVFGF